MRVHIDTKRKHAFVVSSSDIKKLWAWLEENVGTVTAEMKCSDDGTREFDNLKKLTSYENPPARQIVSLDIESESDGREKFVGIRFSDSEFSSISIDIKAQEQTASEIRERISEILDGTKPWYGRLPFIHHSFLGRAAAVFIAAFISSIATAHIWEGFSDYEFTRQILLVLGGALGILMSLGWLRSRLFPVCCFTLGQGEHRYRKLVTIHRIVFGLLATLIISLAVGAMYR